MNLFAKLIEKLKEQREVDFVNFDTKYKRNLKIVEKNFEKMQNGVNNLWDRKEIDYFVYDPFAQVDEINAKMMEQTNSEGFSFNFSHIIVCAKIYAANYIATDEGKTYKEIKFACERLCEMIDSLNFNLMAHVNFETKGYVKYVNGSFHVLPDSYESNLVKMTNSVNAIIGNIAAEIYKQDKDAVYAAFRELCNDNLYSFNDQIKDIFEL